MRPLLIALLSLLCLFGTRAETPALQVDLRHIGPIAPKGRVQDRDYNPRFPEVDRLIAAGPAAIPFLISKLEDETRVEGNPVDFWPKCTVGDVAWMILADFFTTADWKECTVQPALGSFILPHDQGAYAAWETAIRRYGRKGIRKKVEAVLRPYGTRFVWDAKDLCFRPAK